MTQSGVCIKSCWVENKLQLIFGEWWHWLQWKCVLSLDWCDHVCSLAERSVDLWDHAFADIFVQVCKQLCYFNLFTFWRHFSCPLGCLTSGTTATSSIFGSTTGTTASQGLGGVDLKTASSTSGGAGGGSSKTWSVEFRHLTHCSLPI